MSTSEHVNYSIRPSKSIQRQLAFGGIQQLKSALDIPKLMYVGFGSVWFSDFVMAHKLLDVDDMISMEQNDTIFRRAKFNAPYSTVAVHKGTSSEVLPVLYEDEKISSKPWIIWLDYDKAMDETGVQDIRNTVEKAPSDSIVLVTFKGKDRKYGVSHKDKRNRLRHLLGGVVPNNLPRAKCDIERFPFTLSELFLDFMKATAASARRPGGFLPAFSMVYRDGAIMVTVGGLLPSSDEIAGKAREVLRGGRWKCQPKEAIVSPLLTMGESMVLQSKLPNRKGLTRDLVKGLGFDLEEEQIRAYEKYYNEYPYFAQIVV